YSDVDVITDFNSANDTVFFDTSSSPAGSRFNYVEERLSNATGDLAHDYYQAFNAAVQDIGSGTRFAFYTNGTNGYLFADLNNEGVVDTGIELRGLDSLNDFSYADIH